jgi:hypothetical protein
MNFSVKLDGMQSVSVVYRIAQTQHVPAGVTRIMRDLRERQKTLTALQDSRGEELFSIGVQDNPIAPPQDFFAFMKAVDFRLGRVDYDFRSKTGGKVAHLVRAHFYRDVKEEVDPQHEKIFGTALRELSETALWGLRVFNNKTSKSETGVSFLLTDRLPYHFDDGTPNKVYPKGLSRHERKPTDRVLVAPALVFKADTATSAISLVPPG